MEEVVSRVLPRRRQRPAARFARGRAVVSTSSNGERQVPQVSGGVHHFSQISSCQDHGVILEELVSRVLPKRRQRPAARCARGRTVVSASSNVERQVPQV